MIVRALQQCSAAIIQDHNREFCRCGAIKSGSCGKKSKTAADAVVGVMHTHSIKIIMDPRLALFMCLICSMRMTAA
jgi:hypothetical protein